MEAFSEGDFDVFAYESLLHTRSPLLRWLYCESHAHERFAVDGFETRLGEYRFRNVLVIPHAQREALLDRIFSELSDTPGWAAHAERRFMNEGRTALRLLGAVRRSHRPTGEQVERLLHATSRFLSLGIFKEAVTNEGLEVLLAQFMPVEGVRELLPQLWQPRCVPHFLKFELRVLAAAERLQRGRPGALAAGIARAAHHSRFLVEDSPAHDPKVFAELLEGLVVQAGPRGVRAHRLKLLAAHHAARRRADAAQRGILAELEAFGRHTLPVKRKVHAWLRFVRFLATGEELKHIVAVECARAMRRLIDQLGLPLDETGKDELVLALDHPANRPGVRRRRGKG